MKIEEILIFEIQNIIAESISNSLMKNSKSSSVELEDILPIVESTIEIELGLGTLYKNKLYRTIHYSKHISSMMNESEKRLGYSKRKRKEDQPRKERNSYSKKKSKLLPS